MQPQLTVMLMQKEESQESQRDPQQSFTEKCFTGRSFTKAYNTGVDFSRL